MASVLHYLLLVSAVYGIRTGFRRHWRRSCNNDIDKFLTNLPTFFRRHDQLQFPFFARPGFRGIGIPSEVVNDRMGVPCDGPVIEPLTYGSFYLDNDTLTVKTTLSLVTDERKETGEICLILVDSGMATQRMPLLKGLSAVGVRPEYVNNVVLTHMDLDTIGNLNMFPKANVYVGNRRAKGNTVFFPKSIAYFDPEQTDLPYTQLCDNTFILLTPGFTNEDISLVVRNVTGYGTVALSGNLIISEEDMTSNDSIKRFGQTDEHKKLWESSRKEIVCSSDYIVPGYGKGFKVNEDLKKRLECDKDDL
ncbi:unnamed protein product [Bursaphelenchus okinawaensis]|uniref:Metallo-beta-lactamase domain-containing protein 1 n=1 Tax=Bursaphelenchus okinawaensis TaxID=465554 RepID=A0A811K7D8_9BILA|nr:unnamed protein product [Bursaphelenchus okinawaensis]CAG9093351.1 unnamed protein product [Bursaphelenchus okinawaensis]